VSGLVTLFQCSMRDAMIEAIGDLFDSFMGSAPPPIHSSPAGDGALIRKQWRSRHVLRGRKVILAGNLKVEGRDSAHRRSSIRGCHVRLEPQPLKPPCYVTSAVTIGP
jgi:hypothetical protein